MQNKGWDNKKKILVLVITVLGILGVVAIVLKSNIVLDEKDSSYVVSGILYHTTLAQEKAKELSSFLEDSLKEGYLPEELNLVSATAEDGTKEFRGTWLASDNELLNVLYVLDNRERIPLYMRAWRMNDKLGLDDQVAIVLSEEIFNEDFLSRVGEIKCQERVLEGNPSITECTQIQKQEEGEIIGVTLYSPILIEELGSDGTVVSACLVPKENATSYIARTCI